MKQREPHLAAAPLSDEATLRLVDRALNRPARARHYAKRAEGDPRAHLRSALRALLANGGTMATAELLAQVRRAHPGEAVRIGAVLERATALQYVDGDARGHAHLTVAGEQYARNLPPETADDGGDDTGAMSARALSEHERRSALCASGLDPSTLTRSQIRAPASRADLATPPPRAGADRALEIPSRFGDTLRYRDGRVTDLHGRAL